jgi:hypothetical protein
MLVEGSSIETSTCSWTRHGKRDFSFGTNTPVKDEANLPQPWSSSQKDLLGMCYSRFLSSDHWPEKSLEISGGCLGIN